MNRSRAPRPAPAALADDQCTRTAQTHGGQRLAGGGVAGPHTHRCLLRISHRATSRHRCHWCNTEFDSPADADDRRERSRQAELDLARAQLAETIASVKRGYRLGAADLVDLLTDAIRTTVREATT